MQKDEHLGVNATAMTVQIRALEEMIEDTKIEIFTAQAELEHYAKLRQAFRASESSAITTVAFAGSREDALRQIWLHEALEVHTHNLAWYEARLSSLQGSST